MLTGNTFKTMARKGAILALMATVSGLAIQPAAVAQKAAKLEDQAAPRVPAKIGNENIVARDFINQIYQYRGMKPIWQNKKMREALADAVNNSDKEGLLPSDFHLAAVNGETSKLTLQEDEILMTDALISLLYQMQNGKVDPESLDQDWNYDRILDVPNALEIISEHLDRGDVSGLVELARQKGPVFDRYRAELARYRTMAENTTWKDIPGGDAIKSGASDRRLPAISERLAAMGFGTATSGQTYTPELEAAVKRFQLANGLENDGVIGGGTVTALNMSPSERADKIRVNMERAKWIEKALLQEKDLVVVNIAGFTLRLLKDGEKVLQTEVIVGKQYTQTPVFTGKMIYTEFNPTWTIPPSIIRSSIIPHLRKDPNYLNQKGYDLYTASGQKVDATQIDWASQKSFPYTVVQPPGPQNALGQVKFIFPNKHNVYLHDTPSRSLFSRNERAFSHGCIRVHNPIDFAEHVLNETPGWDRAKIDATVNSKVRTRTNLNEPLRVAILYWTVDVLDEDTIFYPDIYKRDDKVLKAINAPFKPKALK